jgi:ElaB/YqjD/DUF883 family membrane-anchored ribosome-binding protein
MAEERNLGVARAHDTTTDDEASKAELQRRMEEARESISNTVTEIKDTVSTQYQAVRNNINEALDWREQYRKRPVAFSVGALSVGFLVGYGIAGTIKERRSYDSYTGYGSDYDSMGTDIRSTTSYSPESITGDTGISSAISYQPQKPGLIQKFKETKAYDRLQEEVATLGDRLLDELSNVARTTVLPALLSKVKDLVGVDLNTQQTNYNRPQGQQTATGNYSSSTQTNQGGNDRRDYGTSQGTAGAYGTSENVGYTPS